jgi:hypothetical protein
MARIIRRPLAGTDIADIWGFIAEDSIPQADAWVARSYVTGSANAAELRAKRARL